MIARGVGRSTLKSPRFERALSIAIPLILVSLLLWLGIPRTVAAWVSIEGDAVFDKIWDTPPPSDRELQVGAAAIERAVSWAPSAQRLTHLAVIQLTLAKRLQAPVSARANMLVGAERHLEMSLSIDPADGFSWLSLVAVRQLHGAPARQIAVAAIQSLDMAPTMRWLWLARAEVLFGYSSSLEEDELAAVSTQLRTIWVADPSLRKPLVDAAVRAGGLRMLFESLKVDAGALAELRELEAAMPRRPVK